MSKIKKLKRKLQAQQEMINTLQEQYGKLKLRLVMLEMEVNSAKMDKKQQVNDVVTTVTYGEPYLIKPETKGSNEDCYGC